MTHMYFSSEGRISYGHLGRTNSCYYYKHRSYCCAAVSILERMNCSFPNFVVPMTVHRVHSCFTGRLTFCSPPSHHVTGSSHFRKPVSPDVKLAVTLRYMATCDLLFVTCQIRTALSRAHTSAKAAYIAKLLLLNKHRVAHIPLACGVWRCPT